MRIKAIIGLSISLVLFGCGSPGPNEVVFNRADCSYQNYRKAETDIYNRSVSKPNWSQQRILVTERYQIVCVKNQIDQWEYRN